MGRALGAGNHRPRRVLTLTGAAVLVALWLTIGPRQLGGSTTLAVVSGGSMTPALTPGDVILLRERGGYATGDVVGYHDPTLAGALVVHRITGVEQGRFVTRGDANGFADQHRPSAEEIVGRLWLTAPGAGGVTGWLLEARNLALVAGGLAGMTMLGFLGIRRREASDARGPESTDFLLAASGQAMVLAGLSGIVVFGGLTLASMLTATSRTATEPLAYVQSSAIRYASGPPVAGLYDGDRAVTGDPVFLAAAEYLDVEAAYTLESDAASTAMGVARLEAVVADEEGWQRTIPLVAAATIEGPAARVSARLALAEVQAVIEARESITGVALREYEVELRAHVETTGAVEGRPFVSALDSALPLVLTAERLFVGDQRLERSELGRSVVNGAVTREVEEANAVELLGIAWETREARQVSAIGLLASVAFTLVLASFMTLSLRRGEPARIQARYGPLLVPVEETGTAGDVRMIDVGNMRALASLATRYQEPILHLVHEGRHEYLIYRGERGYRYATKEEPRRVLLDLPWRRAKQHDARGRSR